MKWIKGGIIALAALAMASVTRVDAQGVEGLLRQRERLQLTDEQVQQLDAMREQDVERRTADMARMQELRSRLAAGEIRRSDLMAAMEQRRDSAQARREQRRDRIDSILTEAQRDTLQQMRQRASRRGPPGPAARRGFGRARPGGAGFRGAPRGGFRGAPRGGFRGAPGFGPRGGAAFGPGSRGFGPGRGPSAERRDFPPDGPRGPDSPRDSTPSDSQPIGPR